MDKHSRDWDSSRQLRKPHEVIIFTDDGKEFVQFMVIALNSRLEESISCLLADSGHRSDLANACS